MKEFEAILKKLNEAHQITAVKLAKRAVLDAQKAVAVALNHLAAITPKKPVKKAAAKPAKPAKEVKKESGKDKGVKG